MGNRAGKYGIDLSNCHQVRLDIKLFYSVVGGIPDSQHMRCTK